MIVHFSASARDLKDRIEIYRKIQNQLRLLGHSFQNDWVETAWYREMNNKRAWDDIGQIVSYADNAITHAEVVIAEASDASVFGVGYEVALALQRKKPVLVLVDEVTARSSYAKGLTNDLLTYREYNQTNLGEIIENFLSENTVKTKDLRFNFVVDRRIYNHLRAKAFRTRKTKGEILRELLVEDIEREMQ